MRDILIDGLPILDLLEVTPSTGNVATLANCDQSSVSRLYRHVSTSLQLGFRKRNGTYRAHTNQELLASLRQAAQLLRLQRGAESLQWVGSRWNGAALAHLSDHSPLPRPWGGERRTHELLAARVLDLAVVDLADAIPDPRLWSAVPLAHYPAGLRPVLASLQAPGCRPDRRAQSHPDPEPESAIDTLQANRGTVTDVALVRTDHRNRPAIQALITALQRAYRQAYGHLNGIRWP